jgi:hypothetical protein
MDYEWSKKQACTVIFCDITVLPTPKEAQGRRNCDKETLHGAVDII